MSFINLETFLIYEGCNDGNSIEIPKCPGKYYSLKNDWINNIASPWEVDLAKLKVDKIKAIDAKTSELIAQGFSFDGKQFSLSANAQQNLATIQTLIDKDLLDPESLLSTIDDELYILRREDAPGFVQAGYARVIPTKMLGSGLKGQVVAATTQEAIESIVDSRV